MDGSYWQGQDVVDDIEQCDCLIIHYMQKHYIDVLMRSSSRCKVVWATWGGDYYEVLADQGLQLLLPKTREIMNRLRRSRDAGTERVGNPISRFKRYRGVLRNLRKRSLHATTSGDDKASDKFAWLKAAVERIDLVSLWEVERPAFESCFQRFRGSYLRIPYYSVESTFTIGPSAMHGPDILLGNSATPENNHVEILYALSRIDLDGRNVLAPLSYGDDAYADYIEQLGKELLGPRFRALREYMPLSEYYEQIGNCGILIMNHIRQQAGTTVASALYKGAVVYLRSINPLFIRYKERGLYLYDIDSIEQSDRIRVQKLDEEQRKANKWLLKEEWGEEALINGLRNLEKMASGRR